MSELPLRKLRARLVGATILACVGLIVTGTPAWAVDDDFDGDEADLASILLPTGHRITPTAAAGAVFAKFDPELAGFPKFRPGMAVSTAVSPDGHTLLVLTSGFNLVSGPGGTTQTSEYVFVYDIGKGMPVKKQVVQVPNTFLGLAFGADGKHFYVSGGGSDIVFTYGMQDDGSWAPDGAPIPLGHASGLGLFNDPPTSTEPKTAGGIAVTRNGKELGVANIGNDSISIIDLEQRRVRNELDLRPGALNPAKAGVAGGEYPWWVAIKGNETAFISSVRDRQIVVVNLKTSTVTHRIPVRGNPNKMLLDRAGNFLFVACDNSDTVAVIDTRINKVVEEIWTVAPKGLLGDADKHTGAAPNDLLLSADEGRLYVTQGGANAVAVIELGRGAKPSRVLGLLPTGWQPNSLAFSADQRMLYVVNGKDNAGPNPKLNDPLANQYIEQLEQAGLLSFPLPNDAALDQLTRTVAANNGYSTRPDPHDEQVMREIRKRIKHVIYVIKENRTYDQILGDLKRGNGDPKLAMFGRSITPNQHNLASQFVTLDNFFNSGEVSGDGWPWSTSGRESDYGIKILPSNYAGRGTGTYDFEGLNRDINVGIPSVAERQKVNPATPDDPNLLPGAVNVVEPDGPKGTPQGKGYIWDAVLRNGGTLREYGCMSEIPGSAVNDHPPRYAFKAKVPISSPNNPELRRFGDVYYRGYDNAYPDFYRMVEWKREFALYEKKGFLPTLQMVQLPGDHMGSFDTAIDGVNTPETQQATNDFALGTLVDRVAHSRFKNDTLIISVEDDSQDGPDHVDGHRTIVFVAGPYVKQHAVVSRRYTTVNLIRTIEDVLGTEHLNLNTATQRPMVEIFDLSKKTWTFDAHPSNVLRQTQLPIDFATAAVEADEPEVQLAHDWQYWYDRTKDQDFSREDRIDTAYFNRVLWEGLMPGQPYPIERSGEDLSQNREALMQEANAGN